MKPLKVIAVFCGLIVLALVARIWWAARPPKRPKGWPTSSTWMVGYHPVLSFQPQGAWVACWLEAGRNADRCKFADYKGRVFYEHDYATCDGQPTLPNYRLRLQNQGSIWMLRLTDGTLLVQTPCPVRHGPEVIQRP